MNFQLATISLFACSISFQMAVLLKLYEIYMITLYLLSIAHHCGYLVLRFLVVTFNNFNDDNYQMDFLLGYLMHLECFPWKFTQGGRKL